MSFLKVYEGVFSALPTPMTENGEIHIEGLLSLMEWQAAPTPICGLLSDETCQDESKALEGVSGFVLYGTTGESSTLSLDEKEAITMSAVERFPHHTLIAGIGTNATEGSASLAHQARSWGADGGLLVTPYYNRPSQEGLYRHILSVAERVPDWPLVLYVVPSRAAVTIEVETLNRILTACPQVIAVKDASADIAYGAELISCCEGRAVALSGDDPTALASWAIGARGSISVISNLCPAEMVSLWRSFEKGHLSAARSLFHHLHPLIRTLFIDTNPIPLKFALAELIHRDLLPVIPFSSGVRLPLAPLNSHCQTAILSELERVIGGGSTYE